MAWFKRKKKEPKVVEVGRAFIRIVVADGREFTVNLEGYAYSRGGWEWTNSAQEMFDSWQLRNGKTGTVNCGHGSFVPMCNIHDISVKYEKHSVVVEDR